MSSNSDQEQIRAVAQRITRRLSHDGELDTGHGENSAAVSGELNALRTALAEIQKKLTHIESHITHDEACESSAPADQSRRNVSEDTGPGRSGAFREESPPARPALLNSTYIPVAHPSQDRFGVGEAVAELVDFFERDKVCKMEPGEKPCDHCGMCSSRGF